MIVSESSFLIIQPSLLYTQPRKLAGIENHRGGKQSSPKPKEIPFSPLDDSQLGGGDVKSIDVSSQTGESLLGAVGTVENELVKFLPSQMISDI
jgi:hypothetical protein